MSVSELVALLDPPASDSMGAVPFVVRESNGTMTVRGLSHARPRVIALAELQELLAARQAMSIEPSSPMALSAEGNPVVMWIGERFAERANALGMPEAPLPADLLVNGMRGRAAVGATGEVYARLEAWVERAFRRVVEEKNNPLALLMAQVLPGHILTQAARWFSAPSKEAQAQELAWFRRLRQDAGKTGEIGGLETQFMELCHRPPWASVKAVLLVAGLVGTRHNDAARQLVKGLGAASPHTGLVSFGDFLRKAWQSDHGEQASKLQLQEFGQRLVLERPYEFAKMVLAQREGDPALLVIDGVKHQIIKEAIEFIVHKPFKFIEVCVPAAAMLKNLESDVGKAHVNAAQQADTEKALHEMLGQVQVPERIEYDGSKQLDPDQLVVQSRWAEEKLALAV